MSEGTTSRRVGTSSIFAVLYAFARLIPISSYVGIRSPLTLGEVFNSIPGIIFGPFIGAFTVLIGTFLNFALGRPPLFNGLDFIPGLMAAVTAGLCSNGRARSAIILSVCLLTIFTIDPLSPTLIQVAGVGIPFLWMHILSVPTLGVAEVFRRKGSTRKDGIFFTVATVFVSTMNAHASGGILYENMLVRVNRVIPISSLPATWNFIFFVYPIERALFTTIGSILAIALTRSIPRERLSILRGERRTATTQ